MPVLTILTPTRRELHATYVMSLLNAFGGMNNKNNTTGYSLSFRTISGKSNIHHARSIAVSNWYDSASDKDLMLFIDSDHTFSPDDLISAIKKMKQPKTDVVCGVYSNSAGTRPNVYPKKPNEFMEGADDEVWYAGTGFMLISKQILDKVKVQLHEELGFERFWISDSEGEREVIPFFHSVFRKNELSPASNIITWLGEDYSFCARVREAGGVIRAFLSKTIGHDTTSIKYFYPENYINKKWDENTLVYYCGPSKVTFSPKSNNLGGSEQAVVELSRRFAKSGKWKSVHVFGNVKPGIYDGVHYHPLEEFDSANKFGDLILWRGFGLSVLQVAKANRIFIDLHDNTSPAALPGDLVNSKVTKVFVKSKFHASLFPQIKQDKFEIIENGVRTDLFNVNGKNQKREPFRFCWTSSYERNLAENLEFVWPVIKKAIPEAELHVYYGDDFLKEDLKIRVNALLNQPGVVHHGRASLDKIAVEKKLSSFHLYLTNTPAEIDCISVRESAAAGCIPIIMDSGVFSERDGFKIQVPNVYSPGFMGAAGSLIADFVRDEARVSEFRNQLVSSKLIFDWNEVASRWLGRLFA